MGVLVFLDGGLHLVEGLLDEGAILHVQDAVGVALDFGVMGHHHTGCCAVLTFSLGSNTVDIEDQIHDGDCGS